MNKTIYGVLVFLVLLFVTLGAASAADVSSDDTGAVSDDFSNTVDEVVEDVTPTTSQETTSATVGDNSVVTVGDNEVIDGNGTTYTNTSFKVTGNNAVLKNFQVNDENIEKVIDASGVNNLTIMGIQIVSTSVDGATFGIDFTGTTNSIIKDSVLLLMLHHRHKFGRMIQVTGTVHFLFPQYY